MEAPEAQEIASLYGDFMREIKTRFEAISLKMDAISENRSAPSVFMDAEFCILQIRFICELVALAALTAHQPLGLKSELQKAWNARKIFENLAKLNPECFPRAARLDRVEGALQVTLLRTGIIDRAGLQAIYDQCGEALHRGVFKHAVSRRPRIYDIGKIDKWAIDLGILLSSHVVMVLSQRVVLLVQLSEGPEREVKVSVAGQPAIQASPGDEVSAP